MEFEICAADFHRDDLLIRERGRKAAASDGVVFFDQLVVFDYQTVNGNDKSVCGPLNCSFADKLGFVTSHSTKVSVQLSSYKESHIR